MSSVWRKLARTRRNLHLESGERSEPDEKKSRERSERSDFEAKSLDFGVNLELSWRHLRLELGLQWQRPLHPKVPGKAQER